MPPVDAASHYSFLTPLCSLFPLTLDKFVLSHDLSLFSFLLHDERNKQSFGHSNTVAASRRTISPYDLFASDNSKLLSLNSYWMVKTTMKGLQVFVWLWVAIRNLAFLMVQYHNRIRTILIMKIGGANNHLIVTWLTIEDWLRSSHREIAKDLWDLRRFSVKSTFSTASYVFG